MIHYRESEVFLAFCGNLDGVALLPLDKVQEGKQHLRDVHPCGVPELLDYFDTTNVRVKYKLSRHDDIAFCLR